MLTRLTLAAAFSCASLAAVAQTDHEAKARALFEAMQMPAMLDVMRLEGIAYGTQIGEDLFPGQAGDRWTAVLEEVYDIPTMEQVVQADFTAALEGTDVDAMLAFFTSEPGQTFAALEISAREAFLDSDVEEASKEAAAIASMDETQHYLLVKDFIDANDMIEANVVAAMNANYAFYMGLLDGGGLGNDLTEDQVLVDVWAQEDEIRAGTSEWVYSVLMLAYQPASATDLETYVAFARTDVGQDLNRAIFAAFDDMFIGISGALGRASSEFMIGADL